MQTISGTYRFDMIREDTPKTKDVSGIVSRCFPYAICRARFAYPNPKKPLKITGAVYEVNYGQ